MVKAIRIYETGGPQVLRYEEVELPAPGPGEAQIVHKAIGVNYIDVYLRSGAYPADLPFIPGYEGAGEVVALGEGVDEVEIGERVAYVGPLGRLCGGAQYSRRLIGEAAQILFLRDRRLDDAQRAHSAISAAPHL